MVAGGGGANISNLNQRILGALTIKVPPLDVQDTYCSELEALSQKVECASNNYIEKLAQIDAVKQSLLQKAFAGELT